MSTKDAAAGVFPLVSGTLLSVRIFLNKKIKPNGPSRISKKMTNPQGMDFFVVDGIYTLPPQSI
ncbi:MAG: hypothetical protein FWD99_08460 [Oscillospiraceae bacterium]|nr:hypothetical protein [Oscillospiraceae bacterium]